MANPLFMRPSRLLPLFLLGAFALACGGTDTPPSPSPPAYGKTPEEGLRASLNIDGATVRVDAMLDNGDAADVYAPDIAAAERADFEDRFPVVVLLQGGLTPKEQYSKYAEALAGYGFVVIVPEHLQAIPPMFPDPVQITVANVIPSALSAVEALDGDATSKVYRIADLENSALTGHSQGGITGLLAIAKQCLPFLCTEPFTLPASVRAGALFGTNSVQMGSAAPVETAGFAVSLLQGSIDGRALPEHAALTYETLEPTRALITFEGLNHFAITNDNKIPGTNEDPNMQTVDQAEGTKRIALWTALWLHAAIDTGSKAVAEHWLFTAKGSAETGVSLLGERAAK